jgi:PAS domain S-box-containing protein
LTNSAKDHDGVPETDAGEAPYYPGVVERIGFLNAWPRWFTYFFAITVTLAAIGLRRWLDVFGEDVMPFVLFYPVVLACTVTGGIGPGLVSMVLAAFAGTIFWLEPRGVLLFTPLALVNIALFVTSSAAIITVTHLLRTSYDRLRRSEARLNLSQEVGKIGIWDLDLKTGVLWWSPSIYKLTGFGPETAPSITAMLDRIHPADRERVNAAFETARQGHDHLDLEFRFIREDGSIIWLAGRAELFRDAEGRPSRLLGINFDATPMRTIESERDRAHTLLQTFFDCLPGAAFAKDLQGRYLLGNPIFAAAVDHAPEFFIGKTDLEVLADRQQALDIMANDQAIIASGEMQQIEEALLLPNGEISYWLAVKAPFKDSHGEPLGLMGVSLDVTERRRSEQRLRLLADEVDHRAKNLLGVVQSIVRLTRVDDVAAYKSVLTGRIRALGRAHSLLAASRWDGVDLARLLHEELAPFERTGVEQVQIAGPALTLGPGTSQALAMVLHELVINAARYGALSAESGRLAVTWELVAGEESADAGRIELTWAESGGPAVVAPEKPGFGFTTIRGAVEHQLSGEIDFDWAAAGMTCRMAFPVAGNVVHDPVAPAPTITASFDQRPEPRGTGDAGPSGQLVLIVDDEVLIALTAKSLRELGFTVLGPAHSVEAANALIRQGRPDLAVLDINLAGRSNAPVARALRALAVPFVYCTGYAEPGQQIEPGLEAEMIAKPSDPEALAAALGRAWAGAGAQDATPARQSEPAVSS